MMGSTKIAFPGLGIEEFTLDRVAFEVFGHPVAWYGVIIAFGMLVAISYIMFRTREYKGITVDDVIDFALFVIIFGVIGARLYYVIFDPTPNYHSFIDVIAIWEGGLAIYGGIIAGAVTAMTVCKVKKIHIPCFFDMLAPAVMIAQAIGRWGNFVNGEAHGGVTDSFIRMQLNGVCVHPTFLYESLWNVLGFVLLNVLYRRRKFDGQVVLGYLAWYGLGRAIIEGLRTDSLYIGPLRVSQLVGILSFVIATGFMIYFLVSGKAHLYESASYKEGGEAVAEKTENESLIEWIKGIFIKKKAEKTADTEEKADDEGSEEKEETLDEGDK